jgi:hypothetical protein
MSLHLGAGRLTIDQDGRTSFDTNDKLYHNITTGISGSYSAPARSVSNNGTININTNHQIASCNSFCTHVAGSVKFSGGVHAFPANVWFAYEGGSLFWIIDYHSGIQSPAYKNFPTGIVKYRFFVSGGKVYLNERVAFHSTVTLTVLAHTISWKLKAGRFN